MRNVIPLLGFVGLLATSGAGAGDGSFAIGPGMSGLWHDPARRGHAMLLQVLPEKRVYVTWLGFDPTGEQVWFAGAGSHDDTAVVIPEVAKFTGGRWLNPGRMRPEPWGSLRLTFVDCDRGAVEYEGSAGYGAGTLRLERLTRPDGLSCP
jgi:hypothetical protein